MGRLGKFDNIRQVTVSPVVVEPVPDDKDIGHLEADIVGMDALMLSVVAAHFVKQHTDAEARGFLRQDQVSQECECLPRVEDVVDHDNVSAREIARDLPLEPSAPGLNRRPGITRNRHQTHGHHDGHLADEVGCENERADKDRHEHDARWISLVKIARDLPGEFVDTPRDAVAIDQHRPGVIATWIDQRRFRA